jgi:hypothetical protein
MGNCAAITILIEPIGSIPVVTFRVTHALRRVNKCGTVVSGQLSTYLPTFHSQQPRIELERFRRNNVRIDLLSEDERGID